MKLTLSVKLSGLCASGIFILTAIPSYFQLVRPTDFNALATEPISGIALMENLVFSLCGALIGGIIGYLMGTILDSPQGMSKTAGNSPLTVSKSHESGDTLDTLTGDETFLSDLEGYAPEIAGAETEPATTGDAIVLTEYAEDPSQA